MIKISKFQIYQVPNIRSDSTFSLCVHIPSCLKCFRAHPMFPVYLSVFLSLSVSFDSQSPTRYSDTQRFSKNNGAVTTRDNICDRTKRHVAALNTHRQARAT